MPSSRIREHRLCLADAGFANLSSLSSGTCCRTPPSCGRCSRPTRSEPTRSLATHCMLRCRVSPIPALQLAAAIPPQSRQWQPSCRTTAGAQLPISWRLTRPSSLPRRPTDLPAAEPADSRSAETAPVRSAPRPWRRGFLVGRVRRRWRLDRHYGWRRTSGGGGGGGDKPMFKKGVWEVGPV